LSLRILKIRGHSLFPDFREGDYVLVAGFPFPSGKIRVGDKVVFRQPRYGLLIKRVHQLLENGHTLDVRGTQIDSTDSRNFGPVPLSQVLGKVIWHIRQKDT
jgi:signal peptidase I